MPTFRENLAPSGRMLTRRLENLFGTLEHLGDRLRTTLAESLGQTLGGLVRDTIQRLLEEITDYLPMARNVAYPGMGELRHAHAWRDDLEEADYWEDDEIPCPEQQIPSERLPLAVSTGLQTASWWLQRCAHQGRLLTTLLAGVLATGIAWFCGPLAALVLNLIGSATHFTSASALGVNVTAKLLDAS